SSARPIAARLPHAKGTTLRASGWPERCDLNGAPRPHSFPRGSFLGMRADEAAEFEKQIRGSLDTFKRARADAIKLGAGVATTPVARRHFQPHGSHTDDYLDLAVILVSGLDGGGRLAARSTIAPSPLDAPSSPCTPTVSLPWSHRNGEQQALGAQI